MRHCKHIVAAVCTALLYRFILFVFIYFFDSFDSATECSGGAWLSSYFNRVIMRCLGKGRPLTHTQSEKVKVTCGGEGRERWGGRERKKNSSKCDLPVCCIQCQQSVGPGSFTLCWEYVQCMLQVTELKGVQCSFSETHMQRAKKKHPTSFRSFFSFSLSLSCMHSGKVSTFYKIVAVRTVCVCFCMSVCMCGDMSGDIP